MLPESPGQNSLLMDSSNKPAHTSQVEAATTTKQDHYPSLQTGTRNDQVKTERRTSLEKVRANRQNSKKSTGPRDTDKTRLNARKHGILSSPELLLKGANEEEIALYERTANELRTEMRPQGALQDLLADLVVTSAWRMRMAMQWETGGRAARLEAARQRSEERELGRTMGELLLNISEELPTSTLEDHVEEATEDGNLLRGRSKPDGLGRAAATIFRTAKHQYDVSADQVLGLEDHWSKYSDFSDEEVQKVVSQICDVRDLSEDRFWRECEEEIAAVQEHTRGVLKRRRAALERILQEATEPEPRAMELLLRYEGHASRELHKAYRLLQETQALQRKTLPSGKGACWRT